MTKLQYVELCTVMGRELDSQSLEEMGFSQVDGKYDEILADDLALYRIDKRRREGRDE